MADEKIRYVLDVDDQGTPKLVKFGQASEKAGKQATKSFDGVGKSLEDVGNRIPGVGGAMQALAGGPIVAASAAAAALVGGFALIAKQGIDFADSLNDMSDRTGLAVETLSRLKIVSELGGTSLEEVAKILGKFSSKVADGDKAIKSLNLTSKDSAGAMIEIADKVAAAKTQTEAISIAQRAYGKQWQEMMPILKMGGEEVRKLMDGSVTVSAQMAKDAAAINDEFAIMKGQLSGIGIGVAQWIMPHVKDWLSGVERIRKAMGMLSTGEQDAEDRNAIIKQYSDLLDKRKEAARTTGWEFKGKITINGKTVQQALAEFDAAIAARDKPPENAGGGQVKTPEELEAERKAAADTAKKRASEATAEEQKRLDAYYRQLDIKEKIEKDAADFIQQGVDNQREIDAKEEAESIKRGEDRIAAHNAMTDRMAEGWRSYYDEVASMRQREADEFEASMTQRLGMHNDQLTQMIRGKQSASETMANIENASKDYAVNKGLEFIEEWVAQQLTMAVFGDAMRAAEIAKANATGAAQTAAYAPAAVTASVASWGSAAVVGGAALAAVLAQFAFRETGGNSMAGGRDLIVGERGPEAFRPTRPGQIINHHNTTNQGATITINVASMSAADIARIQRQGVRTRAQAAR